MSARYFVDTNILMYAHDTSTGEKHERAKELIAELWRDRSGVVSTQVLQELSANLRRKAGRPLDSKATREIITDYLTWQVIVNGGDSILEALDLEARYRVSFWDALVLHAAQASGAEVCTPRTSQTAKHTDRSASSIRCATDRARRNRRPIEIRGRREHAGPPSPHCLVMLDSIERTFTFTHSGVPMT